MRISRQEARKNQIEMQGSSSFGSLGLDGSSQRSLSMPRPKRTTKSASDLIKTASQARRHSLYSEIPFFAAHGMQARSSSIVRAVSQSDLSALLVSWRGPRGGAADFASIEAEMQQEDVVTAPLLVAVAIAAAAQFLNGFNTSVMNAPEAVVFPGHTTLEWSLAVAAYCVGAPFGAGAGGLLAKSLGRRGALLWDARIFLVGGLLMACAPTIRWLIVGRFVVGIASGLGSVLVPIYLGELPRG